MKQKGKKKKTIKRNEDNLRDFWENVKCPNMMSQKKTKRKAMRKYLRRQ